MTLQERVAGFPGARDEAWKYTRPAAFTGRAWDVAGTLPADGGFDALNRALATVDGIGAGTIEHAATGDGRLDAVRRRVELAAGERLDIVEWFTGTGASFTSAALEARVGEGAELVHVRVVHEAGEGLHHGALDIAVAAGGRYHLVTVVVGGATVRVEPTVRLMGPGASAELHGIVALRGKQHADHHVEIDHVAPGCTSRQVFRSLLDGQSRGVYTGRVRVRPGADGTDSGQVHRALLLSDDAVANARPQLEIEADDVKCAHGAAIGSLDEEALFYLRQRGLDENEARALLTSGFVNETLAQIAEGPVRERVRALLGVRA